MAERAFEGVKLRNGLLRTLGAVRLFGVVAGGQLLQGEESATSWVFCAGGGLWVEPFGGGRYLLQAGMYAAAPGKVGVWPEDPNDLSSAGMPTQVRKVAPSFSRAWVPRKG